MTMENVQESVKSVHTGINPMGLKNTSGYEILVQS